MDKTIFTVSTKRGERREGLKGLNYNTNMQLSPAERQRRRNKWVENRKKRGDESRSNKTAKASKN